MLYFLKRKLATFCFNLPNCIDPNLAEVLRWVFLLKLKEVCIDYFLIFVNINICSKMGGGCSGAAVPLAPPYSTPAKCETFHITQESSIFSVIKTLRTGAKKTEQTLL